MNAPGGNPLIADIQRAAQQLRNGRRAEAVAIYEDVAARAGDNVAVHVELGRLCNELGAPDQAGKHFAIAVEREPDNAHYLSHLAVARQLGGQMEEAFELFERARAIEPDLFSVVRGLGLYYLKRSDFLQARKYLERARELRPSDPGTLTDLATSLSHLDEHELALKHTEKALRIEPEQPTVHYVYGSILMQLGRTDDAIRHFEKTIREHKTFGAAYDLYARIKKFSPADRKFIERAERMLGHGMPARDRYCLHYALGKMHDDCGDWERAFDHYGQASLLKKQPFDHKRELRVLKQLKRVYNKSSLAACRKLGNPSTVPVFIVGMPRSGTTLMERMIASHPKAAAAGELDAIPRIAGFKTPFKSTREFGTSIRNNLSAGPIARLANEYLDVLQQNRGHAERITDKLPSNYMSVGLISVLFPNATIIHATRHPLDTCLSCYFQNFTDILWANDFADIAQIYRSYRELMDYWKKVLPQGKIVDVSYEALVEDPEGQGRRLLEACGLSWDSSRLEFYREEGVIRTASLWQVRQPIYRSSRMRWKNYSPHLGQLACDLAEYLQDDREELAEFGIDIPKVARGGWARRLVG